MLTKKVYISVLFLSLFLPFGLRGLELIMCVLWVIYRRIHVHVIAYHITILIQKELIVQLFIGGI